MTLGHNASISVVNLPLVATPECPGDEPSNSLTVARRSYSRPNSTSPRTRRSFSNREKKRKRFYFKSNVPLSTYLQSKTHCAECFPYVPACLFQEQWICGGQYKHVRHISIFFFFGPSQALFFSPKHTHTHTSSISITYLTWPQRYINSHQSVFATFFFFLIFILLSVWENSTFSHRRTGRLFCPIKQSHVARGEKHRVRRWRSLAQRSPSKHNDCCGNSTDWYRCRSFTFVSLTSLCCVSG